MSSPPWSPAAPTGPRWTRPRARRCSSPPGGKCLHYYFYFVDEDFGLCYVRVPTWAPVRLQVYFNGYAWLARQLTAAGIAFERADNAFVSIADPRAAQLLADGLDARALHAHLDRFRPMR